MVRRYWRLEVAVAIILGLVAGLAVWSAVRPLVPHRVSYPFIPSVTRIDMPAGSDPASASAVTASSDSIISIPVLSYHQMDNGCAATARTCGSTDSVSQRQFYDQLGWLHARGYHTITMPEYVQWATGQPVRLPYRPVLLTVDDGIANFYEYATPLLQHYGYNAVSMIVSGFANRASSYNRKFWGWDATWTQLQNLPASTWGFAFHAGSQGHLLYRDSPCPYYYACQQRGESAATWRTQVLRDIRNGIHAEKNELGPRIDTQVWAVPFNDLAQSPGEPQSGPAPREELNNMAAHQFRVVFVDGLTTRDNQHYRYEIHGTDSLSFFASQVQRGRVFVRHPGDITASVRAGGQS